MGYWGWKALESDSALDYIAIVAEHMETLWDNSEDHGERMAVVYVLTEASSIDMTDYRGLKAKVSRYLLNYSAMLSDHNVDGQHQEQIDYLLELATALSIRENTSLTANLS